MVNSHVLHRRVPYNTPDLPLTALGPRSKMIRDPASVHDAPALQAMLAQTLQWLEGDGFVLRTQYPIVPPHVEYSLTPMGVEVARQVEAERGALAWRALGEDVAPGLLDNTVHGREAEPGAFVYCFCSKKRIKNPAANFFLHPRSVVAHCDMDKSRRAS